jgi:hypothetical protein
MININNNNNNEDIEEADDYRFRIIVTKAPGSKESERAYCPMCKGFMKYMEGMPVNEAQWICQSCGLTAWEGYGDTPVRDTSLKGLSAPNNPYPDESVTVSRPVLKDVPSELDDELDERTKGQWGRVDIRAADKKRRYGMRFAFMSAEEASRQI